MFNSQENTPTRHTFGMNPELVVFLNQLGKMRMFFEQYDTEGVDAQITHLPDAVCNLADLITYALGKEIREIEFFNTKGGSDD